MTFTVVTIKRKTIRFGGSNSSIERGVGKGKLSSHMTFSQVKIEKGLKGLEDQNESS